MTEDQQQANTCGRKPASTVLDEGLADPAPLNLRMNGQGSQDGCWTGPLGAADGHRREENMPKGLVVDEREKRLARFSRWILE